MTVTPIFDGLAASYAAAATPTRPADARPSRPRPVAVVGSHAFGRGCLEATAGDDGADDDEVTRLLEGARREAIGLGRRWVGTVHLALAAVRAGGDVGRAFGMRGAGPAVLLAALADDDGSDDLAGGDPTRPALSSVARTVVLRVAHRAAREDRAVTAAELAVAVARSGRVAELLERLEVDVEDLVDALTAGALPATPPVVRPKPVTIVPLRRVRVPVGVVAPVAVMVPAATGPMAAAAAAPVTVLDHRATDVPA